MSATVELVKVKIDGKEISVPKGTNLIEAAKLAGTSIPHYCYHKHLSVAGNCRMCQVEVKGQPKLAIGCNTTVAEGMEVLTQTTSKAAADSQAATLEFILINHPLDCTICDQAGHCKLQDYHYKYNARPSRFLEEKEHKVKAVPLGPTVMLDGERCIMCTRCIRFCNEVTKTSELGMLNRGDRSVIAVAPGRELNNPLSGSVVDLCPVGALTHRDWRFNTRIWFTRQTDGICPGCSTGCNVKVAERDGLVVQVKARSNSKVNKSWLCDEGRYGFGRFLPETRQLEHLVGGVPVSLDSAIAETVSGLKSPGEFLVVVEPSATVEDLAVIRLMAEKYKGKVVMAHRERSLSEVEKVLISPNYSANIGGAEWLGIASQSAAADYKQALNDVADGHYKKILFFGHSLIGELPPAFKGEPFIVSVLTDATSPLLKLSKVVIAGRSIAERSGLLINSAHRLQYTDRFVDFANNTVQHWKAAAKIMGDTAVVGKANSDRDITLWWLQNEARVKGLSIGSIKDGGVCLKSYNPSAEASATLEQGAA